ncbi:hypothetical protein EAG_15138 [Camponotus floridanus]|uniref:Uncharacterized protein n=1 Tax=Camponotus floridanus TaxID=104421 RepID=E1ZYN9_CAMFO|nr:hypothetical protein EAG_15138 [Camponotus floridanus]
MGGGGGVVWCGVSPVSEISRIGNLDFAIFIAICARFNDYAKQVDRANRRREKGARVEAKRDGLGTPTRWRRLRGWFEGGSWLAGWLAGREFVRFDIHLEIQFNFPAAIPLSRASQRVENRESRNERVKEARGWGRLERRYPVRPFGRTMTSTMTDHRHSYDKPVYLCPTSTGTKSHFSGSWPLRLIATSSYG